MNGPGAKVLGKWEKADIAAKISIPLVALIVTLLLGNAAKRRETDAKMLETAVRVLESPASGQPDSLRAWALGVFRKAAHGADVSLPPRAVSALSAGAQLPT